MRRKRLLTLPMAMSEREGDDLVNYDGITMPAELARGYAANNMVRFDSLPIEERRWYWGVDD